MACQGFAAPGKGADPLVSRADTLGERQARVSGSRPYPTSCGNLRMQFISHSASDGHASRRTARGTAAEPSTAGANKFGQVYLYMLWASPGHHSRAPHMPTAQDMAWLRFRNGGQQRAPVSTSN